MHLQHASGETYIYNIYIYIYIYIYICFTRCMLHECCIFILILYFSNFLLALLLSWLSNQRSKKLRRNKYIQSMNPLLAPSRILTAVYS